jgi:hypothetical protein
MTVNTAYQTLRYLVNKNQGGYLTPAEFNTVFNMAQREYFNSLVGNDEEFAQGRPIARRNVGMSQRISESLSVFMKTDTPTVTAGEAIKPTDSVVILSVRLADNTTVKRVEQNRLSSYLKTSIDGLLPVYVEVGDKVKIYNTSPATVTIDYLRMPLEVSWKFINVAGVPTLDANGQLQYDSGTSVSPEWSDMDSDKIIMRSAGLVGINLQNQTLIQMSESDKQRGE